MTNTLVIDTSFGSTVGVIGYEPVVETNSRTHVERLQVDIALAVAGAGLEPRDLDRVVVGIGPAPYTGLRAGIVAAKAIAFASGAQLLGQDILTPQAVMARSIRSEARQEQDEIRRTSTRDANGSGADAGASADFDAVAGAATAVAMDGNGAEGNVTAARRMPPHALCPDRRVVAALCERRTSSNPVHITLAVNDARRRELYFTLIGETEQGGAGDEHGSGRILIPMDIDYPDHLIGRVQGILSALPADIRARTVVDVIGHGAAKYDAVWRRFDESGQLGAVVDSSVLDMGAWGLRLFADCAARFDASPKIARESDKVQVPQPGHDQAGPGLWSATGHDETPADALSRVEPLYLRRPDVSIPNPLKHVLNHAQADRA